MKILFLKDAPGQGRKGEVKEISDGFAKNFLIPKGIGRAVSAQAAVHAQQQKLQAEQQQQKADQEQLIAIEVHITPCMFNGLSMRRSLA